MLTKENINTYYNNDKSIMKDFNIDMVYNNNFHTLHIYSKNIIFNSFYINENNEIIKLNNINYKNYKLDKLILYFICNEDIFIIYFEDKAFVLSVSDLETQKESIFYITYRLLKQENPNQKIFEYYEKIMDENEIIFLLNYLFPRKINEYSLLKFNYNGIENSKIFKKFIEFQRDDKKIFYCHQDDQNFFPLADNIIPFQYINFDFSLNPNISDNILIWFGINNSAITCNYISKLNKEKIENINYENYLFIKEKIPNTLEDTFNKIKFRDFKELTKCNNIDEYIKKIRLEIEIRPNKKTIFFPNFNFNYEEFNSNLRLKDFERNFIPKFTITDDIKKIKWNFFSKIIDDIRDKNLVNKIDKTYTCYSFDNKTYFFIYYNIIHVYGFIKLD